ncbi:MAG: alpha/beta hydrolase [Magnetococcales bacterium]|nr:alpha/beta hydrolase [Magnetococcales bacterium]MBF0155828.1 alpha/beta hydrolase [Magnetococcales bacterium]
MELEILSRLPKGPARPVNLLFVHGICVGAWVWEEFFLPFFAERGYPTYAVSLRGHGKSQSSEPVTTSTVNDFTADVRRAMATLEGPTVLIGHSFGGGVVQNYLRRGGKAAGAVLMASVPPYGLAMASYRTLWRNPSLWMEMAAAMFRGPSVMDFGLMRRMLFSGDIPDQRFRSFISRLGPLPMAASMEFMGWRPIAPWPWTIRDILVMGTNVDPFVPEADVRLTASYYGVYPIILSDIGHAMMLDDRWQVAAEALLNWLDERSSRLSDR